MESASPLSSQARTAFRWIGRLDMFRVVQDRDRHLTPATTYGSIISTFASILISLLVVLRTVHFWQGEQHMSMFVPSSGAQDSDTQTVPVHFDITFHYMPCHLIRTAHVDQYGQSLDGGQQATLNKVRLTRSGEVIGDYIASHFDGGILNYEEGCRVHGRTLIDKAPGHWLLGALSPAGLPPIITAAHTIHKFYIGDHRIDHFIRNIPSSAVEPLKGVVQNYAKDGAKVDDDPSLIYKYFLQIVPTYQHAEKSGRIMRVGYQHTATYSQAHAPHLPRGVFFSHRHTPVAVSYLHRYESFYTFIIKLTAIIGGIYTVLGFFVAAIDIIAHSPNFSGLRSVLTKPFTTIQEIKHSKFKQNMTTMLSTSATSSIPKGGGGVGFVSKDE